MNCAVYRAFNAADIQIPFPQRDLHVRTMPSP
jgi:small-conductance mechanosensitive channel